MRLNQATTSPIKLTRRERTGWALLTLLLAVAALAVGWVGFIASDDSLYFVGAEHWLTAPPFVGDNHWSTRFPLTIGFAGMLLVLGRDFPAFAAIALLWYAVLLLLVGRFAQRAGGVRAGWIATLIAATLPVIVAHASTVSVDLLETSMLLAGVLLLSDLPQGRVADLRALLAGVAFGTAILCRETALLALVAYGPLFLLGRPVPRRALLLAGCGIAAVIGGEALFQWALTGDPLRRYTIAFHHDEHIDRAANMEGNFLLHPAIDPLLVLLVNDDFGLLFWLALAALGVGVWRQVRPGRRHGLILLGAMALASFLLVGVLYSKLVLNPRYFMLPAIFAIILVALWADRLRPVVRALVLAAFVGTNLLLLSVGNAHVRWSMEALVAAARAHPHESVAGDPVDVRRARLPMRFLSQANLVYAPAQHGGLEVIPAEAAAPGTTVIARYPSPPTRLGGALRMLGLEPLVPAAVHRRMFAPSPDMLLVRRGAVPATGS